MNPAPSLDLNLVEIMLDKNILRKYNLNKLIVLNKKEGAG